MIELTPKQLPTELFDLLAAGLVPVIKGSPGIGKSDLIRQVAKRANLKVIDFRLSQADPTDLMGFPKLDDNKSRSDYAPPVAFPLEGDQIPDGYSGWLLFFDEITSAGKAVQAASYKIILDRMIGIHNLHKNVAMVAAGNLDTDKAITHRMSTALQSRMVHLHLRADHEDWMDWANEHGIDHRVKGFMEFKSELLHNFNPNHADDTFPCPRTWEFTSRYINGKETLTPTNQVVISGIVGEGAGLEFCKFVEIYKELPKRADFLQKPESIIIDDHRPDLMYAYSSLISELASDETMSSLKVVVDKLPIEFQIICLRSVVAKNREMIKHKALSSWISVNGEKLFGRRN